MFFWGLGIVDFLLFISIICILKKNCEFFDDSLLVKEYWYFFEFVNYNLYNIKFIFFVILII